MHPTVESITRRMEALKAQSPQRSSLSCGNLAHGFAACSQPYKDFPDVIRKAANGMGSVAQFAGRTPAAHPTTPFTGSLLHGQLASSSTGTTIPSCPRWCPR